MQIATFQNKVFKVSGNGKYFFDGLTFSGSLSTESQEKLKSKPSTYIKGDSLRTMSLSVPIFASFGINVRKEIDSWESIRTKAIPGLFVLGKNPIGSNKWLLKTVGVSELDIDNKGTILSAVVKLDFEEYVRAGSAKASKTGASSAPATGSTIQPGDYIFNPPNKEEEKRFNPNASDSYKRLYGKGGF